MARLRAVEPDEKPAGKRGPLSITEAAEAGDQRELLVALRSRLAQAVQNPGCPPRDLAALTRRLQDVARDLEALDVKHALEASEDAIPDDEEWDAEAL